MRINRYTTVLMFVLLALVAIPASAQTVDHTFDAYSAALMKATGHPLTLPQTAIPDVVECQRQIAAEMFYDPTDFHLVAFAKYLPPAKATTLATDYCLVMTTSTGPRTVAVKAGSVVGILVNGQIVYLDPCKNPVFGAIAMPKPTPAIAPDVIEPIQVPTGLAAVRALRTNPPPPPPPEQKQEQKTDAKPCFVVTFGAAYSFGNVHASYNEAIPNSGDVSQRYDFSALVPSLRVEPGCSGLFASVAGNVLAKTSNMEYQAIDGWLTKRRDSDNSRDVNTVVKVGYQHTAGDYFRLGGFVGWQQYGLHEDYSGQGAQTVTNRDYKGFLLGAELTGATHSADHQVSLNVDAQVAPSLTRTQWTQQTYQGSAFPKANNPDASGHSVGFKVGVDAQLYKMLHGNVGFQYLGITSSRTNTFAADETVDVKAVTIGLTLKWSK